MFVILCLREAYRQDLLWAIEQARQGMLSPHWLRYQYLEAGAAKGGPDYPADGDRLFSLLEVAVASRPQITDEQETELWCHQNGWEVLINYNRDMDTLIHLFYIPEKQYYTAFILADRQAAESDPAGYIQSMWDVLTEWVSEHGYDLSILDIRTDPALLRKFNYSSVEEALRYLFASVNAPESIL